MMMSLVLTTTAWHADPTPLINTQLRYVFGWHMQCAATVPKEVQLLCT